MALPLTVRLKDLDSDAIEARVRKRLNRLGRLYDRITGCRAVIEAPHRQHHNGKLYNVRVDVLVPGGELVLSHDHHEKHEHEDVYVAIRDAFDALERRLRAFTDRLPSQEGPEKAVAE